MWTRIVMSSALVALGAGACAAPASAQDSAVSFYGGLFVVKGEDGRDPSLGDGVSGDVLFNNLTFLIYDIDDFNGGTFGGDYLFSVGSFVEIGVGVGFYQRTVPTIQQDFEDDDGTEIDMDMKLRLVPVSFTGRFFPMGRDGAVQPYVGGGLGLLRWRYSETGEFVDFSDFTIFRDSFVDEGTAAAPVFIGGARFPVSRSVLIGGEYRFNGGEAELDPSLEFFGDHIDLTAHSVLGTVTIKF
jgi:outer membrane protein W